jgi:predicted transcriptional regulator
VTYLRSRLEILIAILEQIREENTRPSAIQRSANVSSRLFKSCMDELIKQGLVTDTSHVDIFDRRCKHVYNITPHGVQVLKYMRKSKS